MDQLPRSGCLLCRHQIPGPHESVAAGDPLSWLAFAIDDGIEDATLLALHSNDAASALLQSGESCPRFECLRLERAAQRSGANQPGLAVQPQPAIVDGGPADECAVQVAGGVPGVAFEG